MRFHIIILVYLLPSLGVLAQTRVEQEDKNWSEIFLQSPDIVLPLLMEAALENSEELKNLEASSQIVDEESSINRKSILNGLSLGASYSYGTMLNFLNNEQIGSRLNAFNLPTQSQYHTGISFNYPISKFFGYRNELEKQKILQNQSLSNIKIGEKEIRKAVILQYQEILLAKAELELYQQSVQTATIHLEVAEKEFSNGEILISEMANISESFTSASIAYRGAKVKYETTILLMEELIGMKIVDLMNNGK